MAKQSGKPRGATPGSFKPGPDARRGVGHRSGLVAARRRRRRLLTDAVLEELEKVVPRDRSKRNGLEVLAARLVRWALEGNEFAIREIGDRIDPKPTRIEAEIGGLEEGEPLVITHRVTSEHELAEVADILDRATRPNGADPSS